MTVKTRSIPPPTLIRPSVMANPVMTSDNFNISQFGPVIITTIRKTITVDGIDLGVQLSNTIIREHGHVASLMIIGPHFELPSPEVRQKADETTKNAQREFVCTANLVLATGMTGSFVTMAMLTMSTLFPKKHRHQKTVRTIEPASAWITEHLNESADFQRRLSVAAEPLIRYASRP